MQILAFMESLGKVLITGKIFAYKQFWKLFCRADLEILDENNRAIVQIHFGVFLVTIGNSNSKSLVFENEEVSTSLSTDVSEIRDLFRQTCNTLDTENYEEVCS